MAHNDYFLVIVAKSIIMANEIERMRGIKLRALLQVHIKRHEFLPTVCNYLLSSLKNLLSSCPAFKSKY